MKKIGIGIGMRNFKTALSVFICIIILRLFHVKYPFYACIASVISMQSSVVDSFTVGKNRMIGTFIGALLGLIFTMLKPDSALLCMLGIVLVIYICDTLGYNKSVSIACIVFLAIMVNLKDSGPVEYSVNRLAETFLGIIVSVLVNYFLSPPNHLNNLYNLKNEIIEHTTYLSNIIFSKKALNLQELDKKICEFENSIKIYISEIDNKKTSNNELEKLKHTLELFKQCYGHLWILASLNEAYINSPKHFKWDINTIYSYHMEQLNNSLKLLI